MKTSLLASLLLVLGTAATAFSQASSLDIAPPLPTTEPQVTISQTNPLISLEDQVKNGGFEKRSAFLGAFDQANLAVDAKLAELRARGLTLTDEAITNLDNVRQASRQTFRDMSLTTVETWETARDNAVSALRRLRGTLENIERTATEQVAATS